MWAVSSRLISNRLLLTGMKKRNNQEQGDRPSRFSGTYPGFELFKMSRFDSIALWKLWRYHVKIGLLFFYNFYFPNSEFVEDRNSYWTTFVFGHKNQNRNRHKFGNHDSTHETNPLVAGEVTSSIILGAMSQSNPRLVSERARPY